MNSFKVSVNSTNYTNRMDQFTIKAIAGSVEGNGVTGPQGPRGFLAPKAPVEHKVHKVLLEHKV
jgi:hypothetical protein